MKTKIETKIQNFKVTKGKFKNDLIENGVVVTPTALQEIFPSCFFDMDDTEVLDIRAHLLSIFNHDFLMGLYMNDCLLFPDGKKLFGFSQDVEIKDFYVSPNDGMPFRENKQISYPTDEFVADDTLGKKVKFALLYSPKIYACEPNKKFDIVVYYNRYGSCYNPFKLFWGDWELERFSCKKINSLNN